MVRAKGYTIINVDSTVCLQTPKIKPYVLQMQQGIASVLSIQTDAISIKATTAEQLGFVGREEGLTAYATVLLCKESIT